MNVMLSFPVAEERQVKSIDLKLNLADDIQAGEEGSLTSHSHNVNLWSDLLSCFRCQLLNLRETQFHAKTLLLREKFGSMKLWTAWLNPTFRIAYFSDYMKHWMWSRKEHKSKTKRYKNFEKLLNLRVPNVMKRDHQGNFFTICPQYLSPGKSVPLYPLFCCPSSDLYRSSSHSRLD